MGQANTVSGSYFANAALFNAIADVNVVVDTNSYQVITVATATNVTKTLTINDASSLNSGQWILISNKGDAGVFTLGTTSSQGIVQLDGGTGATVSLNQAAKNIAVLASNGTNWELVLHVAAAV